LEGKIVMIEDVDEYNYRVDAMLTHLLNAGRIQKAAGIVVGEMTRSDSRIEPSIDGWKWKDVVRDRLAPLGIPMVWDYPFGHNRAMLSVPMGIRARLDAEAGTLEYLEPLCED
ncbi:MAG: LD-carboxypeptidase, partial [Fimbriimonadaceae bacterium]